MLTRKKKFIFRECIATKHNLGNTQNCKTGMKYAGAVSLIVKRNARVDRHFRK